MIDIIPYNQKVVIKRIRAMRVLTVMLWGAIVALCIACFLLLPTLETINSRYTITMARTHALEESGTITKAVDVIGLQKRTDAVKAKLAAALPPGPMQYVASIRTYETQGIRLTGYDIADATNPVIHVHGVATTREDLQRLIDALQKDPTVSNVDSPVTNYVKSTQSDFVITVTFKTS